MKLKKFILSAAILTICSVNSGYAQGLSGLLGGGDLGNTIGNLIEGVFSSSNITIADMAGEWRANGPAVCFQGEGFLKKAGGVAAAAAVETKLAPYYEQYGLNNSQLTIDKDGKFNLTCKLIKLSGTITRDEKAEPGVFEFNFTALGMKLASVTTYVQKTSGSMDIMFDATKLKQLLSAVASFTGIQIVQTVSGILDSYDGLAIGSHYTGGPTQQTGGSGSGFNLGNILGGLTGGNNTGTQQGSGTQTSDETTGNAQNQNNSNSQNNQNSQNNSGDAISNGLNLLKGVLGGKKK